MNPPAKPLHRRAIAIFLMGLAAGGIGGWLSGRQAGNPQALQASQGEDAEAGSSLRAWESRQRRAASDRANRESRSRAISPAESQEFADSVRSIFHENMEDRRLAMLDSLLERASPEHYSVVVSLIRENDLRGTGNGAEWSLLWSKWGTRDPIGALEFVKQHSWEGWNDAAKLESVNRTLTYWSQADPEAARRYVEASPELAGGDRTMVWGLVHGWANVDPSAAADWIFKSGLGMSGEYETVVKAMARRGGHEQIDSWFERVNSSGVPEKDLQGFAETIAQTKVAYEPDRATAWVEKHLQESWMEQSSIVARTTQALANRDPVAAMEWASRINEDQATSIAMHNLCNQNPQAAQDWLDQNTGSPAYASAVGVFASQLHRNNPDQAERWVDGIADEALRLQITEQLLGR